MTGRRAGGERAGCGARRQLRRRADSGACSCDSLTCRVDGGWGRPWVDSSRGPRSSVAGRPPARGPQVVAHAVPRCQRGRSARRRVLCHRARGTTRAPVGRAVLECRDAHGCRCCRSGCRRRRGDGGRLSDSRASGRRGRQPRGPAIRDGRHLAPGARQVPPLARPHLRRPGHDQSGGRSQTVAPVQVATCTEYHSYSSSRPCCCAARWAGSSRQSHGPRAWRR